MYGTWYCFEGLTVLFLSAGGCPIAWMSFKKYDFEL
jgi:hypothetical protein